MSLSIISTFSGGGGSSLGYQMAGGTIRLAIEWDDNAAATYRLNFPNTTLHHGDIKTLNAKDCLRLANCKIGHVDILDGSPPCQGFSTAGTRDILDPRNNLFAEFARLLRGLKPRAFIMENVSGMVKGKMRIIFARCLKTLTACGYRVSVRLLNAMYFGVPQSRERLIFIGLRNDLKRQPTHPPPLQRKPPTVRSAIAGLPDKQIPEIQHVWIDEYARRTKWITHASKVLPGRCLPCSSQNTRLRWDKPSPTLMTSGFPGMALYVISSHIHPRYHRALSVREMARLASFPDDFNFVDPVNFGNTVIGNSVPPAFMLAIAQHVAGQIKP